VSIGKRCSIKAAFRAGLGAAVSARPTISSVIADAISEASANAVHVRAQIPDLSADHDQ
jgi:hypothetical protein